MKKFFGSKTFIVCLFGVLLFSCSEDESSPADPNETGSISGIVTNPQNLPVAQALRNGNTVASSPVEEANGGFILVDLPEGRYTVAINDTAGLFFSQGSITINAGIERDLGNITLQ